MAKKKEPKIKVERSYNIPLRKKTRETAKHKKTPRAIRIIREFLKKHMKAEEVKLGMHLNEHMWKHGIKNPPHHVKVHVIKEDDVVKAELEGFEFKELVKAETKKEPKTMKDKLEAKLGVKKPAAVEEKKEKEQKEEVKAEPKKEEMKPAEPKEEAKIESLD
jgi:large subunit ribosomal protein L31e